MKPRDLSRDECTALLDAGRYGRLGLAQTDHPYVIPMSYVFSSGKIYLHSRGKGKKDEIASKNPHVCFQIDSLEKNRWSSVIVYGTALLSRDVDAKLKMFDAFIKKGLGGHGGKKFQREEMERMEMTIWEITVEEMTGREGVW